jgi:hypothetical protein
MTDHKWHHTAERVKSGHFALRKPCPLCPERGHVRCTSPCPLSANSGPYVPPYVRVFRSRSIRLEINGFDHAPPFDDVGSKHRVGSFLIKVEGFKAELIEMRGHFWIF